MSMFRKPGGGGFLAGQSGTILAYKFDAKTWQSERKGVGDYRTLSVEIVILPDGQTDPVQQFLKAGFLYDGTEISADGLTLESDDERPIIQEDTEFAQFIGSIVAQEPALEAQMADGRNFEAITGYRVTFGRVPDVDGQMATGRKRLGAKAKSASDAEIMIAGRRLDPKDKSKSYPLDFLVVTAVLGKAVAAAKAGKKTAAPVKKATNGSGKVMPAPAAASGLDDTKTAAVLIDLLAETDGNQILASVLPSAIVKHTLVHAELKPLRADLQRAVAVEAFLQLEQGWSYDGTMVALA